MERRRSLPCLRKRERKRKPYSLYINSLTKGRVFIRDFDTFEEALQQSIRVEKIEARPDESVVIEDSKTMRRLWQNKRQPWEFRNIY